MLGIHDYEAKADILRQRYASLESILAFRPADRAVFAPGCRYAGQPVMVTECGGISFRSQGDAWGYTDTKTPEEFLETYRQVVASLLSSELVQGFCYTQLTDVQQEQNIRVRHLAPDQQSQPVRVVEEAGVLHLLVLAHAVEAHGLAGLDVRDESRIRWRGEQAVGPIALVQEQRTGSSASG